MLHCFFEIKLNVYLNIAVSKILKSLFEIIE